MFFFFKINVFVFIVFFVCYEGQLLDTRKWVWTREGVDLCLNQTKGSVESSVVRRRAGQGRKAAMHVEIIGAWQ